MIKKLLFSAFIFSSLIAGAQTFTATYSFAATTSVSGTTDPSAPPVVTGLTCGSFMAVGTPSANPNAAARFSFVGWPTGSATGTVSTDTYTNMIGSINTNEYYEVVLTPQSGYTVAFNTIAFTVQRSGTGIRSYVVRTSADGFTNNLPAAVTTGTNLSVVGTNEFFWNYDAVTSAQNGSNINLFGATATSSVSFRFYAWNSEALSGTFSIDNVSFTGTVTGTPPPCNSPTVALISNNSPVCANQQMILQSTLLGDAPFTYTWTGAGSFGSANSGSTTVSNPASGNYTLSVTNACGTTSAVTTATVYALPSVSVNSETVCAGNSATLTATGTATSYSWSTSGTGMSIIVTPTSSATYTVTGTDGNGCTNMAMSSVTVNDATLTVNSPSICAGNSATLTVSGADTYTWSTAENGASIVVTPTASATYSVTGTDVNGCMDMTIASVTFNSLPIVLIDYSSPSTAECENSIDTLIATGANNYLWSSLETNDTLIVTHLIGGTTSWTVTGTDLNGCMDTDEYSFTGITPADVVTVDLNAMSLQCITNGTVALATATPTNGIWSGTGVTGDTFDPTVAGIGTFTITYTSTGTACPGSDSDVITVDACTGIQTLNNISFNLYPNPNNGFVTVRSASFPATLNLFDINGKQVLSQTITALETVVDLSGIANGVYQLNMKTDNNSFNQKVMINK